MMAILRVSSFLIMLLAFMPNLAAQAQREKASARQPVSRSIPATPQRPMPRATFGSSSFRTAKPANPVAKPITPPGNLQPRLPSITPVRPPSVLQPPAVRGTTTGNQSSVFTSRRTVVVTPPKAGPQHTRTFSAPERKSSVVVVPSTPTHSSSFSGASDKHVFRNSTVTNGHSSTFGATRYTPTVVVPSRSSKSHYSIDFGVSFRTHKFGGHAGLHYGYPYYYKHRYYNYPRYCYPSYFFYWTYPLFCWGYTLPIYYVSPGYSYCASYEPVVSKTEIHHHYYQANDSSYERVDNWISDVDQEKYASPSQQHERLGDLFFRAGNYYEAAKAYANAIYEEPERASLYLVLADAKFALRDYVGAAQAIRDGIGRNPLMVLAETDKSEFYGNPDDFAQHMQTLQKHLELSPTDADALLVLGFNFYFSDYREQAMDVFQQLKQLNPEDKTADFFLVAKAAADSPQ